MKFLLIAFVILAFLAKKKIADEKTYQGAEVPSPLPEKTPEVGFENGTGLGPLERPVSAVSIQDRRAVNELYDFINTPTEEFTGLPPKV